MAKRSRNIWSRFHFLIRFLGLTGLICAGVAITLAYLGGSLEWDKLTR